MPVNQKSEMVRFALPCDQADAVRAYLVEQGVRDTRPGIFFRDQALNMLRLVKIDDQGRACEQQLKRLEERVDQLAVVIAAFADAYDTNHDQLLERLDSLFKELVK